ncbi:hypothetical protein BDY17DRAFT_326893 [Neohortaea acidophila]|uniref:Inner centromere protein ARK-binding domain-containing protein n=1 Tax=Neohortaea acidophila TaxID=245834 RepID=A0A6A6PIM1_9PEZI|nr:uncharacterized protein BDY17DRAFT_326893 [Neohortaea acidophila]KAF2479888.1 hypothetical protein BDY17DRAFT_326893 [Neohortaea acidophila]
MALARSKTANVGTAEWLQTERQHADDKIREEVEEFGYAVKNELEWLNAHLGEVFSQSQVNFTDIFKTPGKLRGKTPRTLRKQNALSVRQPLTDVFAENAPAPASAYKTTFFDKVAQFQIAEDVPDKAQATRPRSRANSPQRAGQPGYTDSGYHGMMTEDEMELDYRTDTATQKVPLRENQPPPQRLPDIIAEARDSGSESFASAKEDLTGRSMSKEPTVEAPVVANTATEDTEEKADEKMLDAPAAEPVDVASADQPLDEESSRSDASSPARLIQRKSSFVFTALPAREPFTAQRSLGVRDSQVDMHTSRDSALARPSEAKVSAANDDEDAFMPEQSETSKAHNKTSTQLLHERITMLGKTKEPRASKSIPQNVLAAQPTYPQLPTADPVKAVHTEDDSDDDWIAPTNPAPRTAPSMETAARQGSPARPPMHQKAASTTQIPSPSRQEERQQKAISVSNPSTYYAPAESTTPAGSPPRKKSHDGPLSASKNKFYSVLKSAKSMFASSTSASAAAKLEAHNNSPSRSPTRDISNDSKMAAVFNMPGALYSEKELPRSPSRPISMLSASPSKKSRKSDESERKREKELKAQQKSGDDLEKAREKERQKAAKARDEKDRAEQQQAARSATADTDSARDVDIAPPPPPKSGPTTGKLRAPVRLGKPIREQTAAAKPAPVSVRVLSQSQRLGPNLSKSQHEAFAPPPVPPKQNVTRPGSAQGSVRSSTAPANSRVRALEAAARKKEADERAAQEKAEKKRELERKRAAKAEEDRKMEEERKAAEQQRVQEAKMAAQRLAEKQAADAKKREAQRAEQIRLQEEAAQREKARAAHELAEAIKRERAQQAPAPPRGDVGGTLRQLAKNTIVDSAQGRPQVQPNAAKPAPKRVWQGEEGDEPQRPTTQPPQIQRPGLPRAPPSYQQHEAKRRRTNEEEQDGVERHSVMAPPKRASNMRKESTLSKFAHGYAHAPPPPTHLGTAMFKAAVTSQHPPHLTSSKPGMPTHPSQMVQISNARIPFAENANPPAAAAGSQHHHAPSQHPHPGMENMHPSNQAKHKTPARPPHMAAATTGKSAAKSSPLYPNGDAIQLPEIATDSEEEDSDEEGDTGGFRAPSWVASPALRDLLTQQQLVDPETVFGPIAELRMDEVFKNAKNPDRLKRLRERGSSARWVESGDAVTSAEKRRDMELRERVVREGGWRYEPNV